MAAYGFLVPYGLTPRGLTSYRVAGVRATRAAAEKWKLPAGALLVEFDSKPRVGSFLDDTGARGIQNVKHILNPSAATSPAKRARRAKRPAKKAAKNPAKNARWEPPPLDGWGIVLEALNAGGRVRASETSAAVKALRRLQSDCGGRAPAKNPRPVVMSRRVLKLFYVHAGDGREYVHDFAPGVSMLADGDTVITLERPDGRPLSQNF